jgi:hypothetical protein
MFLRKGIAEIGKIKPYSSDCRRLNDELVGISSSSPHDASYLLCLPDVRWIWDNVFCSGCIVALSGFCDWQDRDVPPYLGDQIGNLENDFLPRTSSVRSGTVLAT